MVTRSLPAIAATAAAALLLSACTSAGGTPDPVGDSTTMRLVAFDSCAETLDALRKAGAAAAARQYGFDGYQSRDGAVPPMAGRAAAPQDQSALTGAAPEPAAPVPDAAAGKSNSGSAESGDSKPHSGTNNHEVGVDEADLVKTDGKRLVSVVDGVLRVVDVASKRITGTLDLAAPAKAGEPRIPGLVASQLLLRGSRALVVVDGEGVVAYDGLEKRVAPGQLPPGALAGPKLLLVELAGEPRILGSLTVDGAYLDARQIGAVARVVVQSAPRVPYRYPTGPDDRRKAAAENNDAMTRSTAEDWLPRYTLERNGQRTQGRVGCDQVVHPGEIAGTSMLTVYTFNLDGSLTSGDPLTVLAAGETVYASGTHLYVAHQSYRPELMSGGPASDFAPLPVAQRTEVHQFDIAKPGRPRYAASGSVPGTLLNQYSMSEYDGHLRLATTSEPGPNSQSSVYVLAASGKKLTQVGRVDGLGRGEQIHSVRFVGPVGYVVTFRQTDPLYTVDLRNPRRPNVTGELKIPGYSAYLHPVNDNTLLGVGQDATEQGRRTGTQISVFDVGDPADPRQESKFRLPGANSEAEFDPHAFLYWPKTGLIVVPVTLQYMPTARDLPSTVPGAPAVPDGSLAPDRGFAPDEARKYGYQPTAAIVLTLRDGKLVERGMVRHPFTEPVGDQPLVDPAIRRSLVIDDALWTVSAAGIRVDGVDAKVAQQAWLPFG